MGSSEDSEVEMVSTLLHKAQARCRQLQAHQFFMSRNTQGLENHLLSLAKALSTAKPKAKTRGVRHIEKSAGREKTGSGEAIGTAESQVALAEQLDAEVADTTTAAPAAETQDDAAPAKSKDAAAPKYKETADLKKLVDSFIDSQSGSDDACHSKLLEARHSLNRLHDILTTLLIQVNSTENSLILYDKELQEKLREMQEIEAWKDAELKKCKAKKEADKKMFIKLTAELKEMHQIASPATVMNLENGTLSEKEQAKPTKRLSLSQENAEAITRKVVLLQEYDIVSSENPHEAVARVPALVQSAQDAAHHFLACATKHRTSSSKLQGAQDPNATSKENTTSASGASPAETTAAPADTSASAASPAETSPSTASPAECKKEKEVLEKTFVKAYVELTRLTAEYSALVKSTACEDQVNAAYEEQAPPLQEAAEKLSKLSSETAAKLKELRPRLDRAIEANKRLRKQIAELTEECDQLPDTISDLDKVRDAIAALSLCPGLERPEFKMPKWTGKWIVFSQDAEKQDDKQQDSGMNWACDNQFKGSRAAEASEIQERTILEMPVNNTGEFPLLGECTNCAGDEDATLKSGHARNCWFRGQPLNEEGMSSKCAKGKKVVMCVTDESSIRKIPGEQ